MTACTHLRSIFDVTIKVAFQASITAEVPACSEDGRFGWRRNLRSNSSQRCSRDLDRALRRPVQFLNTHFVKPRLCSKPQCVNGAVILLEEKRAFPEIFP
ncbi:hypothetical protein TNCV_2093201 [Trichonephila clavipes]|nr:hypothetical protein TNCV_2093201 [Trichonephila clavipes]